MTEKRIKQWFEVRDVNNLIKALEAGNYSARMLSAKYLGELRATESINELKKALNDPVKTVVEAAATSLQAISIDPDTKLLIEKRFREFQRQEESHQASLEEVISKRDDPVEKELKKMREAFVLSDIRKKEIAEREKKNTLIKWGLLVLGALAILSALIRSIGFFA